MLGGLEVRLEQRILFRLDLPNRKTVCVKAKPNKLANEVLKPILHKYGYKLDLMTIHKVSFSNMFDFRVRMNILDIFHNTVSYFFHKHYMFYFHLCLENSVMISFHMS